MGCELLREQFDWPAVECGSRDSRELAVAVDAIVQSVRASELDAGCSADAGVRQPEAAVAAEAEAAAAVDAFDASVGLSQSQSERGFTEFGIWVGEERSPSGSTVSATSSAGGPVFFTQNSDGGSLTSAEQHQHQQQQQPAHAGPRRRSSVHNDLLDSVRLQEHLQEHRRSQSNDNLPDLSHFDSGLDELRQRQQSEPEEFAPGAARPKSNPETAPPTPHLTVAMSSMSLQPPARRLSRAPSTEESTYSLPTCGEDSSVAATTSGSSTITALRTANKGATLAAPAQQYASASPAAPSSKAARLLGLGAPNARQLVANRRASEYIAMPRHSTSLAVMPLSAQSRRGALPGRTVTPDSSRRHLPAAAEKRLSTSSASDGIFFEAPTARQQKLSTASSKTVAASHVSVATRGSRASLHQRQFAGTASSGTRVGICLPRALLLPSGGDSRAVDDVGIGAPPEADALSSTEAITSQPPDAQAQPNVLEHSRTVLDSQTSSADSQSALRLTPPHTFHGFSSAQHRHLCLVCSAREYLFRVHSGTYVIVTASFSVRTRL